MKKYTFPVVAVLTVLMAAQFAFGQAGGGAPGPRPGVSGRPGYQNTSEAERQKSRAEWEEMRKKFEKMSPEEKEKFRAEMQERFRSRAQVLGREQQLKVVAAIQEQLNKLKAAIESIDPETRNQMRDATQDERAKLRQKMMAAIRDRMNAARAIEQELAKLPIPGRSKPEPPRPGINELRAIHRLAVKEKATETAKSIEKLIARYERGAPGRGRPDQPRPRGQRPARPARPDRPGQADAGRRARPFVLKTFDGKTVNLADYRGKTVVLEWLNFECPFVKHHYEKTSTMIDLANKYKDKGVVWFAINSTSHTKPAENQAFAAKHELPYPLLDDRSGKVGRAYGAKTTPHMFVIAPSGGIAYDGAIDNSPMGKTPAGQEPVNYVDKVLGEVIARRDISTRSTKPYGCSVKYAK
ncbi:MAG: redoxin domain-containing protein [Planctomycetota bacterium]|jgi:peroxiredoxin